MKSGADLARSVVRESVAGRFSGERHDQGAGNDADDGHVQKMISGIWPSSTDVPLLFPAAYVNWKVTFPQVTDSWVTLRRPFVP